jgi:type I restriction enzyme M protein
LLRGDYKQSLYGRIILPFTVLRRLDCVLAPTKEAVLKEKEKREAQNVNPEPFMIRKSGLRFVNTSRLDMNRLMGDVRAMKERFPELVSIYHLERVLMRGLSAGIA